MNQNTINVVEATPPIVNALKILKQRTPTMNENSSTKPFGSNGGVKFTPTGDAEDKITGPFDVQLTYLEEDGEMVPYIQVLDSSVQNATYAGYVYYQNQILNVLPDVLAPSAGWLYLDIDLLTNTYTYNIGNYVPTYPLAAKHWCYALAYITYSNNTYTLRRVHVPGNIIMPTLDYDKAVDMFKITPNYTTNKIDVSSGRAINGSHNIYCSNASFDFPVSGAGYYIILSITYSSNSYSASLSTGSSIVYPTSFSATYTLTLGFVTNTDGAISVANYRHPGPVYIEGRWS